MSKIRFGVTIDAAPAMLWNSDYKSIREISTHCETLSYDSLWVMDHFTWGEAGRGAVFEAWVLLSALATETRDIRLGTLVACNSYRSPSLTAKMAATLDVISNGRLTLGYGAGWKKDEYESYGFPFPQPSVRIRQMREGVIVIKELWTEERASFSGEYYTVKDALCRPKPLQKPHPPIVLGGGGEKVTLKTVAEFGDGWNVWGASVEDYERKVDVLTEYCDGLGRRMESIELSWGGDIFLTDSKRKMQRRMEDRQGLGSIVCTYDECVESLQRYIDLGCSHFIFSLGSFSEDIELFAERILPSF